MSINVLIIQGVSVFILCVCVRIINQMKAKKLNIKVKYILNVMQVLNYSQTNKQNVKTSSD